MAQNQTLKVSPSHTITVRQFETLKTKQEKEEKLIQIAKQNLQNTLEILKWNVKNHIYVYRMSSKLIPLATWRGFTFHFEKELENEWKKLGEYIRKEDLRISFHPDQFSVINTPKQEVFEACQRDLAYHSHMFECMGLDERYKIVMHVGGVYGNKQSAKDNFIHRFEMLPPNIQNRIILENDDKSYTSLDVLEICEKIKIPMVLDVHHFAVNKEGESLKESLKRAIRTWEGEYFCPKLHFSSPRNEKEKRAHAEYINFSDFQNFFYIAHQVNHDLDIMLEAKAKELSLLRLRKQIEKQDLLPADF